MLMRLALGLGLVLAASGGLAQVPPSVNAAIGDPRRPVVDSARDAARQPAAMLVFAGIRPGMKVAELIPGLGYFTRLFAIAVKPDGHVFAIVPEVVAKMDPGSAAAITGITIEPAYGDVTVAAIASDPAIKDLDVFWTSQNYHDLHNVLPPEGVAATNRAIFNALKPGGVYIVVDHVAVPGSGITATKTLHRIDPAAVKAEVVAAGFVYDGESDVLRNPADPHTAIVFDPGIRGHTDQFVYRFRKPG